VRYFLKLLPALALAAAACGEGPRSTAAPLDRFTYPTGLALVPVTPPNAASPKNALVVVSSNFDLRFDQNEGGSVIAVDPDASNGDVLAVLGAVRIGSFGGEAGIVSPAPLVVPTGAAPVPAPCPGWPGPAQVLVPVRNANVLYRLDLDAAGGLSCGAGCRNGLSPDTADAYGVQVVCRSGATPEAFVSHLRTVDSRLVMSRVDLNSGALSTFPPLVRTQSPAQSFAFDAARDRLFITGRFGTLDFAPLRWLDLGAPVEAVQETNFGVIVRGSDLRGIALSSDGTRAYLAMRIFDRDLATSVTGRPLDSAGALAVIDLTPGAGGAPANSLVRLLPVGLGPTDVEVLPRGDGRRDVVAVSSGDEGTVTFYDDDSGAIALVLDRLREGVDTLASGESFTTSRTFGKQALGLASEPATVNGRLGRRLYVGSFDRGFIRVVDVDVSGTVSAAAVKRFGREVPAP
jgi:hypothetical protein